MQVVINHLTRMQPGYICTAGLELTTGLHVRPLVEGGLRRDLLQSEGGLLELRAVVELGPTRFTGRTPEIEDRFFERSNGRSLGVMDPDEFTRRCAEVAADSLVEIFGEALQPMGATRVVPENGGLHSLGCCWARDCELLVVTHNGGSRLKMRWRDRNAQLLTAVADLRGFGADHRTIDQQWVTKVNSQLAHQERTLLAVGLSRAYRKSESEPAMHWLQVNNVLDVADEC